MVLHRFDCQAHAWPAMAKPTHWDLITGSSFPCDRIFGDTPIVPGYVDLSALFGKDRAQSQQRPGDLHPYLPV
jgi:hypothetical protein